MPIPASKLKRLIEIGNKSRSIFPKGWGWKRRVATTAGGIGAITAPLYGYGLHPEREEEKELREQMAIKPLAPDTVSGVISSGQTAAPPDLFKRLGLGGAAVGTGIGAFTGDTPTERLINALFGLSSGAGAGVLTAYLLRNYLEKPDVKSYAYSKFRPKGAGESSEGAQVRRYAAERQTRETAESALQRTLDKGTEAESDKKEAGK